MGVKVFGFDIGRANTGMSVYDVDNKKITDFKTVSLPIAKVRTISMHNPEMLRLAMLYNATLAFIKKNISDDEKQKSLAVVEDYAYGVTGMTNDELRKIDKKSLEVSEAHGVVYAAIAMMGLSTIKVEPTRMKLFITGNGRCEKTDIIKKMNEIYGVNMQDDHQYDSLGLVHIGRYFIVFCKNQGAIKEGSYEYNVCVDLAFNRKHLDVSRQLGLDI